MQDSTSQAFEKPPGDTEHSQLELEKRIFHLKTLYEVSQLIGALRDPAKIMQNMLLMVVGTFGALKGVACLVDMQQGTMPAAAQRGLGKGALETLSQAIEAGHFAAVADLTTIQTLEEAETSQQTDAKLFAFLVASQLQLWIPFAVNERYKGGIGLGAKMLGDPYTPDDQELLSTLTNQLTIALDNALAYMEIHELNIGLEAKVQERTVELQKANEQLELHNRFIREAFGRYVSNEVVASLLASPEGLQLGGEKRQVTILMSDLRGFTSLSEHLAPEQVVGVINRYLGTMVDIILQHEGIINEFIGDAILVIFGAPVWREDHAQSAVACAVAMQLAMDSVNAENRREGLPKVEMGIGLNTGEVVVGNIGSHKRTKYGIVGSHVNLTSRIESYTIGGQILISETTLDAVRSIVKVAEQMEVEAKGVDRPITLFDIRGIGGPYNLFLPECEEALVSLQEALSLRYTVMEGKHLGSNVCTGRLVKLSDKGGEVRADTAVAPWSNIKIQLTDVSGAMIPGDIYAKVMGPASEGAAGFAVHFTSVPPAVRTFLQSLLASCSAGNMA